MRQWGAVALLWACAGGDPKETGGAPADTDTDSDTDTGSGTAAATAPVSAVTLEEVASVYGVLRLTWTQDEPADMGWIAFTTDGKTWRESPHTPRGTGTHDEVVLGMPIGREVTVKVVQEVGGQTLESAETYTATNSELPGSYRAPEVTWDPALADPAPYVVGALGFLDRGFANVAAYVVALDRDGELVWAMPAYPGSWSIFPRVAVDGTHLVVDASTAWCCVPYDGGGSVLHRVTLDGSELGTIPVDGLHHSWDEASDGTVIWGAIDRGSFEVLKRRQPGGDEEVVWWSQEWLALMGDTASWAESNTVNLTAGEGSVLFSFYSHETVFEIDLAKGTVLRQFGALAGSYAFDPPESQFWWQHGAHYTGEGTLMVSTHELSGAPAGDRQLAREYAIDDETATLHEVWSYLAEDAYADAAGEAYGTPGGNVLINYGVPSHIREVTRDGVVVWDADWGEAETALVGHTQLVDDLYALMGP